MKGGIVVAFAVIMQFGLQIVGWNKRFVGIVEVAGFAVGIAAGAVEIVEELEIAANLWDLGPRGAASPLRGGFGRKDLRGGRVQRRHRRLAYSDTS